MARLHALRAPPAAAGADDRELEALRDALARASFTAEEIEERLGTHELSTRSVDRAVHLRRLEGDEPFATLGRLFLLGAPVDSGRLAAALAPARAFPARGARPRDARRLGGRRGRSPGAARRLRASPRTPTPSPGEETPFDYVPGIQSPSVTLAKLAVRRPVARALDLGTGCGIQALLAAKHAERVVATDVNPRALAFAAFNLRLNGVDNVELRLGDAFEPVAGERFDLIVANPPYVISPDSTYAYRDSDLPADELCRAIVGDAAEHLQQGGVRPRARQLGSRAGGGVGRAAAGVGAGSRLRRLAPPLPDERPADARLRLAATARRASTRSATRRRSTAGARTCAGSGSRRSATARSCCGAAPAGENWIREDTLPLEKLEAASEHTLRVFAAADELQALGDDGAARRSDRAHAPPPPAAGARRPRRAASWSRRRRSS